MKKMFLVLSLLAVAPIFAEEPKDERGVCAKVRDAVANGYNSVANSVETLASYVPGSSLVSDYVIAPAKNNFKVTVALVAALTYAAVKATETSPEAEL